MKIYAINQKIGKLIENMTRQKDQLKSLERANAPMRDLWKSRRS